MPLNLFNNNVGFSHVFEQKNKLESIITSNTTAPINMSDKNHLNGYHNNQIMKIVFDSIENYDNTNNWYN